MKNKLLILVIILSPLIYVFPQHLPLQIGNQWHYDMTIVAPGIHYAAIVVDTVVINNKTYYKIERRHHETGELLEITYDRFEGDSIYYRIRDNEEKVIINFNWPLGFTRATQYDSSDCYYIERLSAIFFRNIWSFNTLSYSFQVGDWCVGMSDTLWLLFQPEITRQLGCYWAGDGRLVGAIIDGTTYGTLYPLPVELISFNAIVSKYTVTLTWQTASELNNRGFEIYRKMNVSENWELLSFVDGYGTTTEIKQYSYIDKLVESGQYEYKLLQFDFDGTSQQIALIGVSVNFSPEEFSLSQNYPNPFNPSTTIKFSIPERNYVELNVYDALGRNVKTLINDFYNSGSYEIPFYAEGLSSGIYFYQLKSDNKLLTKQMLLIK